MCRNQGVKCADGLATPRQRNCDRAKVICCGLVEGDHRYGVYEGAYEAVQFS